MAPPTRSPLAPARLRLLAALLVAAASMLPLAEGHGFMSEPQARNYLHNWRYCPHCVNFGGPGPSSQGGALVWPQSANPVCGDTDPLLANPGQLVASYSPGSVIDLGVFFSTQHGGRHVFRLCPDPANVTKPCLEEHVLQRADGGGPYSWTPVQGGPVPWGEYGRTTLKSLPGELYTWQYRLPPGLTCERCVLQAMVVDDSQQLPGTGRTGLHAQQHCDWAPFFECKRVWPSADAAAAGAAKKPPPRPRPPKPRPPKPRPPRPKPRPPRPRPKPPKPRPPAPRKQPPPPRPKA
ncbi:hypothetical protein CHLNCDRAFT_144568 [Chlorella variabilis]|uniref:Chitin-binding type-4 domain-containing protein n=1 Tax=Chlorella variabilis TaxID=554065 RepID=E1ZBQ1_CHLVA|nr:hypothetical protein CHLNCDRAFT_144568 [Chlorella variabilis]EFN56897.1 hypothetical protein CHLNCDRAFT_144568 [Chlorella variabilis]|eukprot:XP_005848999.1 hypothetical protein CHLNCDRAFT_144568 [Chlorella variabilis]